MRSWMAGHQAYLNEVLSIRAQECGMSFFLSRSLEIDLNEVLSIRAQECDERVKDTRVGHTSMKS